MIAFLIVSTLIQLFDVYLDWRQKQTYKIKELPSEFEEGFNLSDAVDRKYKKGVYEEKTETKPGDDKADGVEEDKRQSTEVSNSSL